LLCEPPPPAAAPTTTSSSSDDSPPAVPPPSTTPPQQQGSSPTATPPQDSASTYTSSRPFRILFRSEELDLRDIFLFRVHFNLDSISNLNVQKLIEDLNRVEYVLDIKLCFNDSVVSSRKLTINLTNFTINYYRPVFFDYFHLCAVSLSVHGGLIAFHV
jgi:hypothetical protein